jgi:rod shape-determining protein MreC
MSNRGQIPIFQFVPPLILASLLLILSSQNQINWLTAPINWLLTPARVPLVSTRYWINQQVETVQQLPHQQRIIKDLKRQQNELALRADRVVDLEKENAALRSTLAVGPRVDAQLLPAKVVGLSRFAVINQGSSAGVKVGQAAVLDGVFLGTVVEVRPQSARIRLLSDPDTSQLARTLSGDNGVLSQQNTTLVMSSIPQSADVKVEEPIFTRADNDIPDGLLIGMVKSIDPNPRSVYKSAVIEPAASIADSQILFIILD